MSVWAAVTVVKINPHPLKQYLVGVCVRLRVPEVAQDGEKPAEFVGYFANLGVAAVDDRSAKSFAELAVTDGIIDWSDSECLEVQLHEIDPRSRSTAGARSGRVFGSSAQGSSFHERMAIQRSSAIMRTGRAQ